MSSDTLSQRSKETCKTGEEVRVTGESESSQTEEDSEQLLWSLKLLGFKCLLFFLCQCIAVTLTF